MDSCRCLCFGSSSSTCLKTVLLALSLLPLASLLVHQQQPLCHAAARLILEYPDSAASCPLSIETHFAPWSHPTKSSKAARLRYFPHTCDVREYYFHAPRGTTVGVEFRWIHVDSSGVDVSSSSITASTSSAAAASPSAPLLAVYTVQKREASSFSSVPQSAFGSGTARSSIINGSVRDGSVKAAGKSDIVSSYVRRLDGISFAPSPVLRPLWEVRSSAIPSFTRSANQEGKSEAAAAPGTPPRGTPKGTAAARTPTATPAPSAAAAVQHANRAGAVGGGQRRLSTRGKVFGVGQQSAEKELQFSSVVASEYSGAPSPSRNSSDNRRGGEADGGLVAGGPPASQAFVGPKAAAHTRVWSTLTSASDVSSPHVPSNNTSIASVSAPTAVDLRLAGLSFTPTASSRDQADFSGLHSASAGADPAHANLGAVVLHGGGRGGDLAQRNLQKTRRRSSSRWQAIVRAAEAFRELHKSALRNGSTATRWLVPWPPEPTVIPYISIQRLRGSTGGGGEEGTEQTVRGREGFAGKGRAPARGMTYAVNGNAAAAEALEGLPQDDDEFVLAAASLFDINEEQTRTEDDDDGSMPAWDGKQTGINRESSARVKASSIPPTAAPNNTMPVHMSRLQWSGGQPFPIFERSNLDSEGNAEEAAAAKLRGRKRALKRRKRKSKRGKAERRMMLEADKIARELHDDAKKGESESRELSGWDTAAVGTVAATRNPADVNAVAEGTLDKQVGGGERGKESAVVDRTLTVEGQRAAQTESGERKETGRKAEDQPVTQNRTEGTADLSVAAETAVACQEGETTAAPDCGAGTGGETGAVIRGARTAAAGDKAVGDERAAETGDAAVADRGDEATAAVDEEVVATRVGEKSEKFGFLETVDAWQEGLASESLHASPSSGSPSSAVPSRASPAGPEEGSSPPRRLLTEGLLSSSTTAEEHWGQKRRESQHERQEDADTRVDGAAGAAASSSWEEGERNRRETVHSSADDGAPAAEGIRPVSSWRQENGFTSIGESEPSALLGGHTGGNGSEEDGASGSVALFLEETETVNGASPGATAKEAQGDEGQRHKTGSSSLQTGRTSERGARAGAAAEGRAAGQIATVTSAPLAADEDEFWLFDRCHDVEAIRRIIVTANVVGARAVVFTGSPFSPPAAPTAASSVVSFESVHAASAAGGVANAAHEVQDAPSLLAHFAAPAAAAGDASIPAHTTNPFIASASSVASASMPVFSIPDTAATRRLKMHVLRQTSVRVAVDTLPADVSSCHSK